MEVVRLLEEHFKHYPNGIKLARDVNGGISLQLAANPSMSSYLNNDNAPGQGNGAPMLAQFQTTAKHAPTFGQYHQGGSPAAEAMGGQNTSTTPTTASSAVPNTVYQYEDNDIQAILSVRLQQLRIQNPQRFNTPVEILAAVDNISGSQLENRLRQEANSHQGTRTLLIPCNLGNAHWVGMLLELNAEGQISRAECIDSLKTTSTIPETFQIQLKKVYPEAHFEPRLLLEQDDYNSCGAYTIENLLMSTFNIKSVEETETIRRLHLEALRQYNEAFYHDFNDRQRNNRPTTATLHEQLVYVDKLKNIWFSKQELNRILAIKQSLSFLPPEPQTVLLQAFQHNSAYNDDHALHLNKIRTALREAQLEQKALTELMQLLFEMPSEMSPSLDNLKFRVSYNEILAITQRNLAPDEMASLRQTLAEQIKQDEEFAKKLQAELWRDETPTLTKLDDAKSTLDVPSQEQIRENARVLGIPLRIEQTAVVLPPATEPRIQNMMNENPEAANASIVAHLATPGSPEQQGGSMLAQFNQSTSTVPAQNPSSQPNLVFKKEQAKLSS